MGRKSHIGKSELVATAKERVRIGQQRLDMLDDLVDGDARPLLGLGLVRQAGQCEDVLGRDGDVCVGEEGVVGAAQGAFGGSRGRNQVVGLLVGQELGHNGGLDDDLAVEGDGGDQAAGVDGEVLGRAWDTQVNGLLLVWDAELEEDDLRAVRPFLLESTRSVVL